jgi:hypothetical protein
MHDSAGFEIAQARELVSRMDILALGFRSSRIRTTTTTVSGSIVGIRTTNTIGSVIIMFNTDSTFTKITNAPAFTPAIVTTSSILTTHTASAYRSTQNATARQRRT